VSGIYVAGCEPASGKSAVALGLQQLLVRRVTRLGVFRPVVAAHNGTEPLLDLLRSSGGDACAPYDASVGVTYEQVRIDEARALEEIVARYHAIAAACDRVLVVGTDYAGVGPESEFAFNARVALNLGLPVICVVSGHDRRPDEIDAALSVALGALERSDCEVAAAIANRVPRDAVAALEARLAGTPFADTFVIPEVPLLMAPTVGQAAEACEGEMIAGDRELLGREALDVVVGAMTPLNVIERLEDGALVITPGDRIDILLATLFVHISTTLPALSGIVLTGGLRPPEQLLGPLRARAAIPPIVLTPHDTFDTAQLLGGLEGRITADAPRKIDTAVALFEGRVDGDALLSRVAVARSRAVTPLMFEYELLDRARASRRHIVLPEGTEERILRAAETLLLRRVVELTLLGAEEEVQAAAGRLGLDVSRAHVVDPRDPELLERFAQEYATRRAHKGVTIDAAQDVVAQGSYFGTMMVLLGMADGMVSGATHTTADTIRPSLEVVKTRPGFSIVSSVFFMCLSDRVLVYGDCAVNPNPTAEQLADIAISSAETAAQFGVEPRIAMLSYSTGASGAGAEVERVRAATEFVRERAPELSVEGPIQYDAAVDAGVARTKLPDSEVAGRATVFIFPDLNTGNNTYKAVQRSADAIAVGPVLQGLNKPVNDLSRGATVQDIVNTVAITAVQAQAAG
jgi:phosphate acetyltransferase